MGTGGTEWETNDLITEARLNQKTAHIGSEPTITYAGMIWIDTTNNLFKRRNADNDDWEINIEFGKDAILASIDSQEYLLNSVNITDILTYPQTEASYIIWSDGEAVPTYYAKNGITGIVTSNANWETLLTSILGGGSIVIKPATFTKTTVPGIVLASNTKITLESGVTITFSNNVGAGATFFNITDSTDVEVSGGVLDGNKANQGATEQIAFSLTNSKRIKIGCAIRNLRGENIDSDDISIYNWVNPDFPKATKTEESYDTDRVMNAGWVILSDFETDSEWTGTNVLFDNVIYYSGTQSCYRTVAGGSGAVTFQPTTTVSKYLFDNSQISYRVKLRTDNPSRISYMQSRMYMNDINNRIQHVWSMAGVQPPANEWVTIYGDSGEPIGSPNPTTISSFRLYVSILDGVDPVTIWVDKLEILPSLTPYGAVTFTMDASYDSIFENFVPIMREYGFRASMFPTPVRADMDARLEDWAQLQRDGWDIFDHSTGGYLHLQTTAENEYYRMAEIDYMISHGFMKDLRALAAYGGTVDEDSLENALEYYHLVRRTVTSKYHEIPPTSSQFGSEGFIIGGTGIEDSAELETYKGYVDQAIIRGKWLIFFAHRIESDEPCLSKAEFRELLDYIVSKGVSVVTIGDVMETISDGDPLFQKTSVYDLFMDVLAISATHVRSNEDLSAAIPITFTIDAQPDVPRTLSGHFDSHAQITAYTIVITGRDARNKIVSETITEASLWDWETRTAFATITSIIMTSRTGTGVGDTMDIGITDVLGLSSVIYEYADIYKIKKNNANEVVASAQINVVKGTYDMAVIGLAGGDDFTIWYDTNRNIIK